MTLVPRKNNLCQADKSTDYFWEWTSPETMYYNYCGINLVRDIHWVVQGKKNYFNSLELSRSRTFAFRAFQWYIILFCVSNKPRDNLCYSYLPFMSVIACTIHAQFRAPDLGRGQSRDWAEGRVWLISNQKGGNQFISNSIIKNK